MKSFLLNTKTFINSLNSKTAINVSKILLRNAIKISVAESCTGGLISSRLTDIAGSSAFITANFVTYSNESKQRFLNVSEETLKTYGAVSAECAKEMALGLYQLTGSEIILCTTGVAGPNSSERKPVGLIYIACYYNNNLTVKEFNLTSAYKRKNMKFMFSELALNLVLEILQQ